MKWVGLLLLAAACSAKDEGAGDDAEFVNVTVAPNQFQPASLTIKVGQTVRWTWRGGTHNVVSGPDCDQADGVFKSGAPIGGGTFEHHFEVAGTFPYHCESHCQDGMKGEIVVE